MGNLHLKKIKNNLNEEYTDSIINHELERANETDLVTIKLLLLGPGSSGKSTIFKQLIGIYDDGFTEKERDQYKAVICENIITSIKLLIDNSEHSNETFIDHLKSLPDDEAKITLETANAIGSLWKSEAIQDAFSRRNEFHLIETAPYFFEKIHEIAEESYIPSMEDIVNARLRTTGINERSFNIDNVKFHITDVGGQRNERSKWIHCFEYVTALLFVASISDYDQMLEEDVQTNAMTESLDVYSEVTRLRYFEHTNIILFLNKKDLLKEKVKFSPISRYFNEFEGDTTDYNQVVSFIKNLFISKSRHAAFVHVTCATDKENVRFTFEAVKNIVMTESLSISGIQL